MIRVHGISDIGIVRKENQDALLIHEPPDERSRRRRGTLLAVADGMGGLEGGSQASHLAVETLVERYYSLPGEAKEALRAAVEQAGRVIYEYAVEHAGGQAMGTTLTAAAIFEHSACIAQVGDSRAYHYRAGSLRQITKDHSLVRELADRGEIDPQSLDYTFHRNVLTRGLGLASKVEVDIFELAEIAEGDYLLVTSDGLHELLSAEEVSGAIEAYGGDLEELCGHLVDAARRRGGPDNITVGVASIGVPPRPAAAAGSMLEAFPGIEKRGAGALILAFLAGLGLGVLSTLLLDPRRRTEQPVSDLEQRLERLLGPAERTDSEIRKLLEGLLEELRGGR
jgi:serine/threonine protein phosphatase PrpC